ncbi:hypothetical protein [Polyangium jinanense]|uniref:Uncharacterized protein n=1 Tax=Polyangium jinanense TaxID=2829994 RepID=A0A9X3X051_9BACT|nr:hypothetical protein [Polyangium jinanense]MDC3960380.1 hypothetical protein [Polyangium jinanense]MDC3979001.1 hypothetical protein [Polyangium jinanense]
MTATLGVILGACGTARAVPRETVDPASDPALASVHAAGVEQVRRRMWWAYADDTVLYRGTIDARNNLGALPDHEDEVVSGSMVGRLDRQPITGSVLGPAVAIRLVRDGDDRGALLLWQPASDATITGIVGPFERTDGVGLDGTRCTGCVTPFAAAPPSIRVDAAATGAWGDGTAAHAWARGELARIARGDLRAPELAALIETEWGIEAEAHDGAVSLPIDGVLSRKLAIDPPPAEGHTACAETRAWTAVGRIALPDLTVRVTDVELGPSRAACCVPEHVPCSGPRCVPVPGR